MKKKQNMAKIKKIVEQCWKKMFNERKIVQNGREKGIGRYAGSTKAKTRRNINSTGISAD